MNQDQGKILVVDDDRDAFKELAEVVEKADKNRTELKTLAHKHEDPWFLSQKRQPLGNPNRPGPALTAAESDRTEKTADGWPIIELYEPVTVKGIWFRITRMKAGSGKLGLTMLTSEEVRQEGLKEFER